MSASSEDNVVNSAKYGNSDEWEVYLEKTLISRYVSRLTEQKVLKTIPKWDNSFILDVGCGYGRYTLLFSPIASEVVALDVSKSMLEKARYYSKMTDTHSKGSLLLADAENIPFRNGVFDVVFCGGLLEHVRSPEKVIREMARVCREEKYLVVEDTNATSPRNIAIQLLSTVTKIWKPRTIRNPVSFFWVHRNLRRHNIVIDKSLGGSFADYFFGISAVTAPQVRIPRLPFEKLTVKVFTFLDYFSNSYPFKYLTSGYIISGRKASHRSK